MSIVKEKMNKLKVLVSKEWLSAHIEKIIVVLVMMLIIMATYKYVAYGETYIYEVGEAEERFEINNKIVSQDIVIDENADWNKHSYAVHLYTDETVANKGTIEVTLSQGGGEVDYVEIRPAYIRSVWCELKLDYSKLTAGYATIQLSGLNLDKPVYVGMAKNRYNIPNCVINGEVTENTLQQRYHYNFNNLQYKLKFVVFSLFVIISMAGIYLVCTKEDSRKSSNLICVVLTISYMCLTFIYDSYLWMRPILSEAVTNFLYHGQNDTLWDNIMQTDAGYWPLFQRLISLIIIRGFRLPAYYALLIMQVLAYFISGFLFSFFAKYQFREYLNLKCRYLVSLCFMILSIGYETQAFINFIMCGLMVIMFYFLVDSKEWTRVGFVSICVFCGLACVSKGSYVTILPFMIICAILFHKNYTKRDYIFSVTCAVASVIQLIYYYTHGSNWVDKTGSAGLDNYYVKLILQSMIDVPRQILVSVLSDQIDFLNGISIFIVIGFWTLIIYLFIKKVVLKYISYEKVNRCYQVFFMAVIYIFGQSLFLRITVAGIRDEDIFSDSFWTLTITKLEGRYTIAVLIAVFWLFIASVKILQEKKIKKIQLKSIFIIAVCIMIGQPRLQLKGIGNDDYATDEYTSFADSTAEYILFKDIESAVCRMVPLQSNRWTYSKNASAYCLGKDRYRWAGPTTDVGVDVTCNDFELEETWTESVILGNYPINTECEIWQVFITKLNLIERSNYKIVLFDSAGNILRQQYQDNTNYQKLTSFTFDTGISGVNQIAILDVDGNRVYIEDSMYIITEKDQQYFLE